MVLSSFELSGIQARRLHVRGIVQGVGFRPFVFRLATAHDLAGWVLNADEGVEIHVEGDPTSIEAFARNLTSRPPAAACVTELDIQTAKVLGLPTFEIRDSVRRGPPTVRLSPDLPTCDACVAELFNPADRRCGYSYINCTACGPRYSIVLALPYDRQRTTMREWPLCPLCAREFEDPHDRRFHAQPNACPACGPTYHFVRGDVRLASGQEALKVAVDLLRAGGIMAIKGIGGYQLACDARNRAAVEALRTRKFRKEKPFAIMTRDLTAAGALVELSPEARRLLQSRARPILLAPARVELPGVAPDTGELGVMLPYAPLHLMLFACGSPDPLVLTSGNRSSEPIAYEEEDALRRLSGIADAFLVGERRIARRVDDSVMRAGVFGPVILRRSRGHAPAVVARLPRGNRPVLALGADLKNSLTLVVEGDAIVSQHLGDLEEYSAHRAFIETAQDLVRMYELDWRALLVCHDGHPQYVSTAFAHALDVTHRVGVQHHRAHIASVVAEYGDIERRLLGVAFDGTGYGDDGGIWGGEFFVGSVRTGLERVAHLRSAPLPGGDAAARHPVQAAAGFLWELDPGFNPAEPPFSFPRRYQHARALVEKQLRTFATTSVGRLFDTAAALLGFVRPITYEGQAASWLEHLARQSTTTEALPFPFGEGELDFRPALEETIAWRRTGRDPADIAAAFHRGLARGIAVAAGQLCASHGLDTVVLSGGVFQNERLLEELCGLFAGGDLEVWTNRQVPPNDGGISLGQAVLGLCAG